MKCFLTYIGYIHKYQIYIHLIIILQWTQPTLLYQYLMYFIYISTQVKILALTCPWSFSSSRIGRVSWKTYRPMSSLLGLLVLFFLGPWTSDFKVKSVDWNYIVVKLLANGTQVFPQPVVSKCTDDMWRWFQGAAEAGCWLASERNLLFTYPTVLFLIDQLFINEIIFVFNLVVWIL